MMEGREFAVDKISDLPCSLLTHILSFLTTEEAVQTCILSKRWTNVWASLPVLTFDDRKFNELAVSDKDYRECEAKFLRFANGILTHREIIPLDKFNLSWQSYTSRNCHQVCKLLTRAVECKPRVISICVNPFAFSDLLAPVFTSSSVEEMSLSVQNADDWEVCIAPKEMNLPSLKKLELGDVHINDGDIEISDDDTEINGGDIKINDSFITMLFSGCPLLEELVMNHCCLDVGEISSDKLKGLALNKCILAGQMQISCPSVVSLRIKCSTEDGITFKNMTSLVNADLCLEDVDDSHCRGIKLLGGLTNVTNLTLDVVSVDVQAILILEILSSNCLAFNNLMSFTLGELKDNHGWYLMEWFLQHSPNLKKLTLCFHQDDKDDSEDEFDEEDLEDEYVGESLCRREFLETVVITGYKKMSGNFARELVSALETLVETIGRIIIS